MCWAAVHCCQLQQQQQLLKPCSSTGKAWHGEWHAATHHAHHAHHVPCCPLLQAARSVQSALQARQHAPCTCCTALMKPSHQPCCPLLQAARSVQELYKHANTPAIASVLLHKIMRAVRAEGVREGRALLHDWLVVFTADYHRNMMAGAAPKDVLQVCGLCQSCVGRCCVQLLVLTLCCRLRKVRLSFGDGSGAGAGAEAGGGAQGRASVVCPGGSRVLVGSAWVQRVRTCDTAAAATAAHSCRGFCSHCCCCCSPPGPRPPPSAAGHCRHDHDTATTAPVLSSAGCDHAYALMPCRQL